MTEVDHIIRNAELRDALEPYFDEAIYRVNTKRMATETENEFLASMLAWERAPVLPVAQWFTPELQLPSPDTLEEFELHQALHEVIEKLHSKRIVLEYTGHLSDRQLYCLIIRDILPSHEKQLESLNSLLHWQCIDPVVDETIWLTYYATDEEREIAFRESNRLLPARQVLPFPRELPQDRS